MSNRNNINSIFDSPWIRKQVEGHLVCGLFKASRKSYWIVLVAILYLILFYKVQSTKDVTIVDLTFNTSHLVAIIGIIYLAKFSHYHQAATCWFGMKLGFAMISFIFILMGAINVMREVDNGVTLLILGIVLMPSLEFLPKIDSYQKLISIFRTVVASLLIPTL